MLNKSDVTKVHRVITEMFEAVENDMNGWDIYLRAGDIFDSAEYVGRVAHGCFYPEKTSISCDLMVFVVELLGRKVIENDG